MYELRPATPEDYEFLYDLMAATMKEYVEQIWGWEEAYQQERFRTRFAPDTCEIVVVNGRDVGLVSVEQRPTEWFLSEIQILPQFQGRRSSGTWFVRPVARRCR